MNVIERQPCTGGEPPWTEFDVVKIDVGCGKVAIVDIADLSIATSKQWRINDSNVYPYAYEGKRKVYLHRLIAGDPEGKQVDHRDGDVLNDRRGNLRVVTHQQNQENRVTIRAASGARGVTSQPGRRKFRAKVKVKGRTYDFGWHDTVEEAQRAAEEGRRALMTHAAECES